MVDLKQLLTEGVFDKGILKAVFMAGGPGSGKSYVAQEIFGIPKKIINYTPFTFEISAVAIQFIFEIFPLATPITPFP